MKTVPFIRALLGCLLWVASCAGDVGGDSFAEPIINGEPSPAAQNAVVLLLTDDGESCSGTLIAENLVLTARHCVADTDDYEVCALDGSPLEAGKVWDELKPESIGVIVGDTLPDDLTHPDARGKIIVTPHTDNTCNADIAFLVLDRTLPNPKLGKIDPTRIPHVGDEITAVGWGISNKSDGNYREQRQHVDIQYVGPAVIPGDANFDAWNLSPNDFLVGEAICDGDSGGPALDSAGYVVGLVANGGNGSNANHPDWAGCIDESGLTTQNTYTRVDGFADLIHEAFLAAGLDEAKYIPPATTNMTPPPKDAGGIDADSPDLERGTPQPVMSTPQAGCSLGAPTQAPLSLMLFVLAAFVTRLRRR